MSWNYRVVKRTYPSGETEFAIHEVYYDKEGIPNSITMDAVPLHAETFGELALVGKTYISALDKPLLNFEDFEEK